MLSKHIRVGANERSLLVSNGDLCGILNPGDYRFAYTGDVYLETETHDIRAIVFESDWANVVANRKPLLRERYFVMIQTGETQIGIIYANGELFMALTPAQRILFWRGAAVITAELVDIIESANSATREGFAAGRV